MRAEDVARLFERKQREATAEIAAESERVADGVVAYEGPGSFMNRACGLGVDGPVTPADIERVIAFFVARGAEPRVEVGAYAHPTVLRGLAAQGFVLRHVDHLYARELVQGDVYTSPVIIPGLSITRVDTADDAAVRAYVEIAESGFAPEGQPIAEGSMTASIKAARHKSFAGFIARIDGEVSGVGGCGVGQGGVALFGATVLPAFRRRGVQQALIAARLTHGRDAGCVVATVVSRPGVGTERNAERFGFRLTYARVVLVRPGSDLASSGD